MSNAPILNYEIQKNTISVLIKQLKKDYKNIVFTNGCFDILHIGHLKILNEAKKQGDILILGLNSDTSIRQLKGPNRPIVNQIDRSEILSNFRCIDFIIIYDDESVYDLVNFIKPNTLVKGGDYTIQQVVGFDIVESYGGQVVTVPFVDNNSTTDLLKKVIAL
jgi:D-beta-D-heptose 7-phosphate kinase/D-beta-D-heptose 1-phosphate adenosyltransferase